MIKRKSVSHKLELKIITACITDTRFIKEFLTFYRPNIEFEISFTKIVLNWCIEYYEQYELAPQSHIEDLFRKYQDNAPDESKARLIEKFLVKLSENYAPEKYNIQYLLKQTEEYFRAHHLMQLRDDLNDTIMSGRTKEGEQLISEFKRVARPDTTGINPITDHEAIKKAFTDEDFLFQLPGDIGKMIGPLRVEYLVTLVMEQKMGKSWWLQHFGLYSLLEIGLPTAIITLENSQQQYIRRIHQNINSLPDTREHISEIKFPYFDCVKNANNSCDYADRACFIEEGKKGYKPCASCKNNKYDYADYDQYIYQKIIKKHCIDDIKAIKKAKTIQKYLRGGQLKLVHFPDGTLTPNKLKIILDNWEYYEDFTPCVLIIDYADKMIPDTKMDWIKGQEYVYRSLKGIMQQYKLLGITASQSNTAKKGKKSIGRGDAAGSIEKLSISDIIFSGNQTEDDYKNQIMRIKMLGHRHQRSNFSENVMVLQCLDIGKPILNSCFY